MTHLIFPVIIATVGFILLFVFGYETPQKATLRIASILFGIFVLLFHIGADIHRIADKLGATLH